MPFEFQPLPVLPDVIRIRPKVFRDDRGWFAEVFKQSEFSKAGIPGPFLQDNHAHSLNRGTLRGLHYQLRPAAQGKLVRCTAGEVFDVAVDLRKGSPTYGRCGVATLKPNPPDMLWIPPGFAHGVQSLTDATDLLYKITQEYSPAHERTIRWDDPKIGIPWPIPPTGLHPRDASAPLLEATENNFTYQP